MAGENNYVVDTDSTDSYGYGSYLTQEEAGEKTVSDQELLNTLSDAIGDVVSKWWKDKILKIKEAWETQVPVTLGSILDNAAIYSTGLISITQNGDKEELGGLLVDLLYKIDDLIYKLFNISNNANPNESLLTSGLQISANTAVAEGHKGQATALGLASDLSLVFQNVGNDVFGDMLEDPRITNSITQLSSVKDMLSVFSNIMDLVDNIKQSLAKIEPYKPYIDILVDMALSMASGGLTAEKVATDMANRLQFESSQLISKVIETLKDYLFKLEISVPSILITSFDTLNISDSFSTTFSPFDSDRISQFVADGNYSGYGFQDLQNRDKNHIKNSINTFIKENPESNLAALNKNLTALTKTLPDILSKVPVTREMIKLGKVTLGPELEKIRKINGINNPIWEDNGDIFEDEEPDNNGLNELDRLLLQNQINALKLSETSIRTITSKLL